MHAERTGAWQQAAASPLKLVRAAHEFEGQMMKELLEPLLRGSQLPGGDDEGGDTGTLGEFGAEALGQALSREGGFGIADRIVSDLSGFGKGTNAER